MFKASAPGNLMLLGEHAVLHHYPAVSCAIDQRITVTLSPRMDSHIIIHSEALGEYHTTLHDLSICKPYTFVLAAIQKIQSRLTQGFDCTIQSDFSDQLGLGSSAAVTVATLHALHQLLNDTISLHSLFEEAFSVILQIQGVGSGADVAASVFGGVVQYQAQPRRITRLTKIPDISAVYSGKKVPTIEVIHQVAARYQEFPSLYQSLFQKIGECAIQGAQFIEQENNAQLGNVFNQQQLLLSAIGVSTTLLDELIDEVKHFPEILGAKISGAGLGDCIITLGKLPHHAFPKNENQKKSGVRQLTASITPHGVKSE